MVGKIGVTLFGTFQLQCGEEDVRPQSRKARGLLAFLITSERRSAPRSRIADLLWSDRGEQQARNSLRQTLHELRAGPLSTLVKVSRFDVTVMRDEIVSDVERILAFERGSDGDGLANILAQTDGGFLDDLDGLSPAYDDWLQGERARQREWLLDIAIRCAADAVDGKPDVADALLRELARIDPLNEEVVRHRLRLDSLSGDIAALHRRYRKLCADLSRDLNVAPSRETQSLFDALVAPTATGPALTIELPSPSVLDNQSVSATPPVVAIAPFAVDGDNDAHRLAALLADAVSSSLSRSPDFRVVQAETISPDQLALMLKRAIAGFSLRVSVRQIGTSIAVTAQLSNVESGFLIWAEQFRDLLPDPDGTEKLIQRIAGAVGPGIERDLASVLAKSRPDKQPDQASTLYSRGKRLAHDGRTLDAVGQGVVMLERVLELDPRHVGARLRLAQLNNTDYHYLIAGHDFAEWRARALTLAMQAAEIEPYSARVQLRLAWCWLRQGHWERAKQLFQAAQSSMGHDVDAINEIGFGLAQLGELDAARELMERAFLLHPFAPAEYHADLAVLKTLTGDAALAEAHFAVCGEQRLFWRVLRLANLYRMDRTSSHLQALQEHFVQTFREIWVGQKPPMLDDVTGWAASIFCFQMPEHRQLIGDGLTAAWLRFSPAILDSSSSAEGAAARDREMKAQAAHRLEVACPHV